MGKIAKLIYMDADMVEFFENQKKTFNISSYIREAIREKIERDGGIVLKAKDIEPEPSDAELELKRLKAEEIAEKNAELMRCKEKRETNMIKSEIIRKIARSIFDSPKEVRKSRYDQFIATTMKNHKSELDELLKERGIIFDS